MLRISKADYDLIRWEAERSYPQECCGILLGQISNGERLVTLTITCENARTDSLENRYSIHPEQLVAALKLERSRGENIIGFYHSHPDHPAHYSRTDLEEAHWFDCSYLIISVEHGRSVASSAFVLIGSEADKSFQTEKLEVVTKEPLRNAV